MERVPGNAKTVDGILHLYLRNEGPTQPDQICASAHLTDSTGAPRAVLVSLSQLAEGKSVPDFEENTSCVKITPPWKPFQEIPFDLHLRVASRSIPLSGSIDLSSTMTSKETVTPQLSERKTDGGSSHECVSSSKVLSRTVMLLPSISSSWFKLPLIGAFVIALGYLLICLAALQQSVGKPVRAPQWSFATSFASNFTIGTGLLTPLLGATVTTDALHYMTKFHYALLSILFAALLLLAPAIFSFFSIPQKISNPAGQTSTVSVGTIGLFLATSALMVCAVLGQLITVGLILAEVRFRGYIGYAPLTVMLCLLLIAGIGTVVSAARTGSYLRRESESVVPPTEHLKSIGKKVAELSPKKAFSAVRSNVFTPEERQTFEHLMGASGTELPAWKMF